MHKLVDLDSLLFAMVNAAERLEKSPGELWTTKQVAVMVRDWVEYFSDDSSFDIKQIPVEDLEK